MGTVGKAHSAWRTAKWVCISYLLSFVAGWLTRRLSQGKISQEDKAALFILVATVATLVIVLCSIGIWRWRNGKLTVGEKRLLVISLAMYPLCFVFGCFTDLNIR
jgi:hypothetical protein